MKKLYLITGTTGHLGSVLTEKLLSRGERVRALLFGDEAAHVPEGVERCPGDIRDRRSLLPFFQRGGFDRVTLLHCAARITVATRPDPAVWETNVTGTENVMALALSHGVDRAVYVSSVHAIPERPAPETITEVSSFSPELVRGQYAKSKAEAARLVLAFAERGLPVSVVHPSGIIGPGDRMLRNHMIRILRAMKAGRIPLAIRGGYDFVDSRDAADGILACGERGRAGECYILSGHYATVRDILNAVRAMDGKPPRRAELPYPLVRALAPAAERLALRFGRQPPLITPYSVYTLHTNGRFSHEKAARELGYAPRPLAESIRDSL